MAACKLPDGSSFTCQWKRDEKIQQAIEFA
jgi:hypothetical protein